MKRFKNILLVDDNQHRLDTSSLQRAVTLAEHNQADLSIIRIMNAPRDTILSGVAVPERLKKAFTEEWQDQLAEIIANGPDNVNITGKLIFDRVFPRVVQEVIENGYDLVMKSAEEHRSLKNRIFGSADMHLLRKCPCPVWIMKSHEKSKYQRIVAAVDVEPLQENKKISNLNRQILELASSLALSEFSELHVAHAWTAWGESVLKTPRFNFVEDGEVNDWVEQQRVIHEKKVEGLMGMLSDMISRETTEYLKPKVHIIKGEAHDVIPNLVREQQADLVVMGTVARTGIPGFLMGNTAENILNNIGCSVLAVKPTGFVTPVTIGK